MCIFTSLGFYTTQLIFDSFIIIFLENFIFAFVPYILDLRSFSIQMADGGKFDNNFKLLLYQTSTFPIQIHGKIQAAG